MATAASRRPVTPPAATTSRVATNPIDDGTLELPSGRSIVCEDGDHGGELVTIRSPGGRVELTVLLTDAGPVLQFEAARLALRSAGDISIEAKGALTTRARSTSIAATRGNVAITANDDVTLKGERVMLN